MSDTAVIESPVKIVEAKLVSEPDAARKVFDRLSAVAKEKETEREASIQVRRGEQEREQEERARDKSGRFAAKADAPKKAEVEPEKVAPKVTKEHPKAETDGKGRIEEPDRGADATANSEKALTALRRAKVPKAVLAGLPSEVRDQWGLELAEIQANTDRMAKEYPDLKKEIDGLKKQLVDAAAKKAETVAEADKGSTVDADLDALLEKASYGDAEIRQALREALSKSNKPLSETIEAQKAALKKQSDEMVAVRLEMLTTSARTDLREQFPKLRSSEGYAAVLKRMDRLASDPTTYQAFDDPYERMRECMSDACAIEFKDDLVAAERSNAEETDRKRLGGQMSSPGRASVLSEMKGRDRGEQIYWLMATENLTGEEARKRVDGLK